MTTKAKLTRRKSQTEIEIPRIGIKVQSFLGLFYLLIFLVSSFCMFVLPFLIPRFKFLHVCSIFPILVTIFELLVRNA